MKSIPTDIWVYSDRNSDMNNPANKVLHDYIWIDDCLIEVKQSQKTPRTLGYQYNGSNWGVICYPDNSLGYGFLIQSYMEQRNIYCVVLWDDGSMTLSEGKITSRSYDREKIIFKGFWYYLETISGWMDSKKLGELC